MDCVYDLGDLHKLLHQPEQMWDFTSIVANMDNICGINTHGASYSARGDIILSGTKCWSIIDIQKFINP